MPTDGDGDIVMRLTKPGGATDDVKVNPGTNISVARTNDKFYYKQHTDYTQTHLEDLLLVCPM